VGGPLSPVPKRRILGMRVDATSYQHATAEILPWGSLGESRYVVPLLHALFVLQLTGRGRADVPARRLGMS
jgi:hypothetical protein